MNQQQREQESICRQIDQIMKNRLRRFKFLMKKGEIDAALCIADEFFEWMNLDDQSEDDAIHYFNLNDLTDSTEDS